MARCYRSETAFERDQRLLAETKTIMKTQAKRYGVPVPPDNYGKWLRTSGKVADYLGISIRTLFYWLDQDESMPVAKIHGSLNSHSLWLDHWRTGFMYYPKGNVAC